MIRLTVLTLFVCLSSTVHASTDFPFTVIRDNKNQIARIEIPSQSNLNTEENLLSQLRSQLLTSTDAQLNVASLNKDEQKVFAKAKAALFQNLTLAELNNPALEHEFSSALPKLKDLKVYRLIASPNQPSAFDQENTVKEVVSQVLAIAKKSLQGSAFEIFEFLVSETLEGLESRREFHQNRLLYWLDQQQGEFSEEERNQIRTSIFYSRLGVLDFLSRKRAQNSWSSYGNSQFAALMKKCNGFVSAGDESFGACFKVAEKQVLNSLVKRSSLSKAHSVSLKLEKLTQVRNERVVILMLKLALRFVPGPGFAKNGVRSWLESQYVVQRRTEGFFFEAARLQQSDDLTSVILMTTANPLIVPR